MILCTVTPRREKLRIPLLFYSKRAARLCVVRSCLWAVNGNPCNTMKARCHLAKPPRRRHCPSYSYCSVQLKPQLFSAIPLKLSPSTAKQDHLPAEGRTQADPRSTVLGSPGSREGDLDLPKAKSKFLGGHPSVAFYTYPFGSILIHMKRRHNPVATFQDGNERQSGASLLATSQLPLKCAEVQRLLPP